MEWNNISENVKDDTNKVEKEEVLINNVTIKHGKKKTYWWNIYFRYADNYLWGNANCDIMME